MKHLTFSCLIGLAISLAPLAAQTGQNTEGVSTAEPMVRMTYVGASWSVVLNDIAEAGNLELIVGDSPSGNFDRFQTEELPVSRAIDVVNETLAEQGVRVMKRGTYLVVLRDETFRARYPRFHYSSNGVPQEASAVARNQGVAPTPKVQLQQSPPNQSRVTTAQHSAPQHAVSQPPTVQRTSYEASLRHDDVFPVVPALQSAGQPRREATVVKPRNLRASTIAKTVYESYGSQAELIENGPLGNPGFRVVTVSADSQPTSWVVGVDIDENRLIIDAPAKSAKQLADLFEQVDDQPALEPLALAHAPLRVHGAAVGLTPIVQSMLAMQAEETPAANPQPNVAQTIQTDEDITRILDRLRSNVTVESLDELGLLILRGNEADVDAVMQIIDAIEKQSIGTTPEVHLRILADVDSEAMADLLNGVYEAVQTIETRPGRTDKRVSITPVVRPNAILIVAPSVELPSILDLVDNLDKPVDPETELRVYRLKYATASRAVETITDFYSERGGLGTRVRVSADARTNAVIVQARPNDLAEVDALLAKLDRVDGGSVNRMQLFPLKNAVATELAEFLTTAIEDILEPLQSGGARVGQAAQENRSVVLEFLQTGDAAAELLRSGVLEDVRISADPRTNSVAVIAPERSLPLFAALIESLDTPSAAAVEVKVFTLSNADASAAVELLDELFEQDGTEDPVGVQLSGTADSASNLLPIRFSVDVRTNSIVATGGPDALTIVEAILLRLDASDGLARTTQVLKLKNSPADDVASAINEFLESQRELTAANPDLVSTIDLLNREVIVVSEPVSNSLLISATEAYFADVLRIASELDAPLQQVIIQAMLVEVELDNADEFGVELGFQDSVLFNRGLETETAVTSAGTQTILTAVQEPGFRFNELQTFPSLGNVPFSSGTVGEQALSSFAVGRVSELGFGGLVLSASSEAVSALIRALSVNREVQVLSRPQIRTVDGQLAQIQVGQSVPIINGVTISVNGPTTPNIEYDESGLILDVTPRINPDGQIAMEVIAERSAYDLDDGVPVFVDTNNGSVITSPIKDITVARSTVSVANGQTIVLGGLITQRDESITRKVPYLGDIPVVGRAFRYDQRSELRTELLIFLTPRVIGNDLDNAVIKEVEAGRLHWFREQAESLHGPIFDVHESTMAPGMLPPGPDGTPADPYCPPEILDGSHPTDVVEPFQLDRFTPMPTEPEIVQ